MKITVNGEAKEFQDGVTIEKIIELLDIKVGVMAAAVNMEIVKKDEWGSFKLSENDKVELLQFVGGG
ncbi:MAG: hypothetical protein KN64_07775 [Sulfurovum sp. AS07-7]|nr:MAG: hypothetical protein KN64_07775 [Sulfurovum sp. AS07-7]